MSQYHTKRNHFLKSPPWTFSFKKQFSFGAIYRIKNCDSPGYLKTADISLKLGNLI